jgi:hypothetical protein
VYDAKRSAFAIFIMWANVKTEFVLESKDWPLSSIVSFCDGNAIERK